MLFVGWTSTVSGYLQGQITLAELEAGEFHFSCGPEHVLRDDGLVPYEATWSNKELRSHYPKSEDDKRVPLQKVDEIHRDKVVELLAMLCEADATGRIFWKIGNQPGFIKSLPPETIVFWQGRKHCARDFV